MCTRYAIASAASAIERELQGAFECAFEPVYNAAPGRYLPVMAGADNRIRFMCWGLVPAWSRSPDKSRKCINAPAGKVAGHGLFRVPLRRSRCLVPANCFYIWVRDGRGGTVPHVVYLADQRIFTMAGLWETWVDAQNGACLHTFCVVTTVACKRLQPFASGMPVIVAPGQRTTYLNTGVPLQRVTRMLRPLETDQINLYPVSPAINDRTADNRDLVQPVGQRIYKEFVYRRRMLLQLEGMGSGKENHGHGPVAGNIP